MNRLNRKLIFVLSALFCVSCSGRTAGDDVIKGSFLPGRKNIPEKNTLVNNAPDKVPVHKESPAVVLAKPTVEEPVVIEAKSEERISEKTGAVKENKTSRSGLGIISRVDNRGILNQSRKSMQEAESFVSKHGPTKTSRAGMQWFDADAKENKAAFISDTIDKNSSDKIQDTSGKSTAGLEHLQKDADETFVIYVSKTVGL